MTFEELEHILVIGINGANKMDKNIKEIIIEYLKKNNVDGLCNSTVECGCGIDNLFLCESSFGNCVPAKYRECENCILDKRCKQQKTLKLNFCYFPL